jgi:hypothetical protein
MRNQEQIKGELEAEREQLVDAVEHLREAANVTGKLKAKLPAAVAVAGGIGAAMRLVRRARRRR